MKTAKATIALNDCGHDIPTPQGYHATALDPAMVARNLDHYQAAFDKLTDDVLMIQAQLSDHNRINPVTGARFNDFTYHEWRQRAIYALQIKVREKRYLKRALNEARLLLEQQGRLIVSVPDFAGLCTAFDASLQTVLRHLHAYHQHAASDEDLDDLVECMVENIGELRERLGQSSSREVAS